MSLSWAAWAEPANVAAATKAARMVLRIIVIPFSVVVVKEARHRPRSGQFLASLADRRAPLPDVRKRRGERQPESARRAIGAAVDDRHARFAQQIVGQVGIGADLVAGRGALAQQLAAVGKHIESALRLDDLQAWRAGQLRQGGVAALAEYRGKLGHTVMAARQRLHRCRR